MNGGSLRSHLCLQKQPVVIDDLKVGCWKLSPNIHVSAYGPAFVTNAYSWSQCATDR